METRRRMTLRSVMGKDSDSALAPRIFLAEDDEEMRKLLTLTLRKDGYQVLEAADGGGLMDLLASSLTRGGLFDVDAVITDMLMPGVTGLRALGMLREYDPFTPVILITAFGGEATHAEAKTHHV